MSPTTQPTAPAADVLPLDRALVAGMLEVENHPRVVECAHAWLVAYDTALSLGFPERVALSQAAHRWELARTAPRLVFDPEAA